MKNIVLLVVSLFLFISCTGEQKENVPRELPPIPHLEKRGNVTQLIVEGKPYLALAMELTNSASSSREYMKPYWSQLKESGVNTVLAVITWEMIEPEEGKFDFKVVDEIIEDARANDLKVALLWFGSWKNGYTSYTPKWVKKDTERFPLALTKDGKQLSILTTLAQSSWEADAKAYAATMKHIAEVDREEQTVIMMQVNNEVGLHGYTRDYHPEAVKAFNGLVPQALIDYLVKNKEQLLPETLNAWKKQGCKTSGTWEEVFGKGDYTDEMFMAWNYGHYMNAIAQAGKDVYPIPTFVNAWIVQPEDKHPGNYPAGGPQAQNHDIWRAAAPAIDILSPDIYLPDYPTIIQMYARAGNPVFVPESRAGQGGAANAAYTIGQMGGIGYSPFGVEASIVSPTNESFRQFYQLAGSAADLILDAQAKGTISATWVKALDPTRLKDEVVMGDYKLVYELVSSGQRKGGAPQRLGGTYAPDAQGYAIAIQMSNDSFLFLGSNIRVQFLPVDGKGVVGLAKTVEGNFVDGKWVEGRWLNGDDIQLRYDLLPAADEGFSGQGLDFDKPTPKFLKVELYKY